MAFASALAASTPRRMEWRIDTGLSGTRIEFGALRKIPCGRFTALVRGLLPPLTARFFIPAHLLLAPFASWAVPFPDTFPRRERKSPLFLESDVSSFSLHLICSHWFAPLSSDKITGLPFCPDCHILNVFKAFLFRVEKKNVGYCPPIFASFGIGHRTCV